MPACKTAACFDWRNGAMRSLHVCVQQDRQPDALLLDSGGFSRARAAAAAEAAHLAACPFQPDISATRDADRIGDGAIVPFASSSAAADRLAERTNIRRQKLMVTSRACLLSSLIIRSRSAQHDCLSPASSGNRRKISATTHATSCIWRTVPTVHAYWWHAPQITTDPLTHLRMLR